MASVRENPGRRIAEPSPRVGAAPPPERGRLPGRARPEQGAGTDTVTRRSEAISPRELSALIGSIYDCALEPSRWKATLTEIMRAMRADCMILSLNDLRNDRLLIDKSVGWGRVGIAERQKHVPEIHARLNEWFAGRPHPDAPFVASRQLDNDYLARSPYVQRCLKPLGIVDVMHQFLVRTPSHFSELVVARHFRHGPITAREVEIAALLLPHIRRAVTISKVLDARAIETTRMTEALDALACGVVITDGEAGILHANRSAGRMLADGAMVDGSRGVLSARVPGAAQELRRAIRVAATDETALGAAGLAICLTQRRAAPVFAHVLPLKGRDPGSRVEAEAAAAIFIGAPAPAQRAPTPAETKHRLRSEYGLTRAEADVTLEIVKGDGRAAAAARLGIAVTTIRAHLSHIYEKTGVRRQAELVRLAMQPGGSTGQS